MSDRKRKQRQRYGPERRERHHLRVRRQQRLTGFQQGGGGDIHSAFGFIRIGDPLIHAAGDVWISISGLGAE